MRLLFSFVLALSIGFSYAQFTAFPNVITDDMPKYVAQNPNLLLKSAANPKQCDEDTIEYARYKASAFQGIAVSNGYALGQYYDAPDSVEVGGVTFYGWTVSNDDDSVTLTISLYKAGIDTLPSGTPLRTATITVDTAFNGGVLSTLRRSVVFSTPYKTADPFIVTIETSDSIRVAIVANGYAQRDGEGENIACGTVGGTWYRCLNLNIGGTTLDCDILLEPHVTYNTYAGFSAPTCFDWSDTVFYTNESSPILSHRMYNRYIAYNLGQYSYYWYYGLGAGAEYTEQAKRKFPTYNNYTTRLVTTMYSYRSSIGCRDTAYQDLYFQPSEVGIIADTPVCSGNNAVISGLSTGQIQWYNNASDTTPFNTGKQYITPALDSTESYYLQAENVSCKSTLRKITIPVAESPDAPIAVGDSICLNSKANVRATANVGEITWWDSPTAGARLGEGEVYVSPSLVTSTTYYAEANNQGCLSKTRTPAYVDVKASNAPDDPITNLDSLVCLHDGLASLHASSPSGDSLFWYDIPSGGSPIDTGNAFQYSPQTLGADYIYVEAHDGQCASSRVQKKLIVWTFPSPTIPSSDTQCLGDTLHLDFSSTFGQTKWYDQATGGNVVYDSNKFAVYGLSTSTTFYLAPYSADCVDTMRHVLPIEIVPFGELSEITGDQICAKETATLSAKTNAGSILWAHIDAPLTVLGTGETFTTEELTQNSEYLVRTQNYKCVSENELVEVEVKPLPSASFNYQVNNPGDFTFLASTSGLDYHWDFGDGNTATTRQAKHVYERNGEFTVVLTTTGSNGCSSQSTRTVKVSGLITNVYEVDELALWIYPNPAKDHLNVDAAQPSKVEVFNMYGQSMLKADIHSGNNLIPINLVPGTYVLLLTNEKTRLSRKLIIE